MRRQRLSGNQAGAISRMDDGSEDTIMTEQERLAWGAKEDAARKADIGAVKDGSMTLEAAQKRARARSRYSGMTPTNAHRALADAQRQMRTTDGVDG